MSWPIGVLIAIDQLGNAIAAGHPDSTISARVGYFSLNSSSTYRGYWKLLEWIIDFTFYPMNGPGHCYQGYKIDKEEKFKKGSDLAKAILGIIIIGACIPIAIFLRLAVIIKPAWGYNSNEAEANMQT